MDLIIGYSIFFFRRNMFSLLRKNNLLSDVRKILVNTDFNQEDGFVGKIIGLYNICLIKKLYLPIIIINRSFSLQPRGKNYIIINMYNFFYVIGNH